MRKLGFYHCRMITLTTHSNRHPSQKDIQKYIVAVKTQEMASLKSTNSMGNYMGKPS